MADAGDQGGSGVLAAIRLAGARIAVLQLEARIVRLHATLGAHAVAGLRQELAAVKKMMAPPPEPPPPPKPRRAARRAARDDPGWAEKYLSAIFDPPPRKRYIPGSPRSLAEALRRGLVPPGFIEDARRIVDSYPYPRRPATAIPARGLPYNDPGWDNVVRAAEEDR